MKTLVKDQINLLQAGFFEESTPSVGRFTRLAPLLACVMISLLFVNTYLQRSKERSALQEKVVELTRQRDALTQQFQAGASPISGEAGKMMREAVLAARKNWAGVLQEVSHLIPEGVWLTTLTGQQTGEIRFDGVALSHPKVGSFLSSIESSPSFEKAVLSSSKANPENKQVGFSIQAHLTAADNSLGAGQGSR